MTLDDNQRIKAAPGVLSRVIDDEAVLLELSSGTYFGLNEVGSEIWQLIADGATTNELRQRLMQKFDVDPETLDRDLRELVAELLQRGLVKLEP